MIIKGKFKNQEEDAMTMIITIALVNNMIRYKSKNNRRRVL